MKRLIVTIRSSLFLMIICKYTKHYNYLQAYLQNLQKQKLIKLLKMPSYEGLVRLHCSCHLGLMK
jgi:hypothetical protein